jgi:transposase InsO family protein
MERRDDIALFRFTVIAPLLALRGPRGELQRQIQALCKRTHEHPTKGPIWLACRTVEGWYYLYRKHGLPGLLPEGRKDKGASRRIGDGLAERIVALVEGHPDLDGPGILAELKAQGLTPPALRTLYRFLHARHLDLRRKAARADHRAYAFELPGDCWQSDVMYGPELPALISGRHKTYLLAILDDASRLIAHAQFYFEQHLTALKDCLKQALLKRGLPKRFYADNGRIFRSRALLLAAAHLGIQVIHSRPFQPEGKAKLERFFRTVRTSFLARLDLKAVLDLGELNRLFFAWLEREYHQRPHRGLEGKTPWDVWVAHGDCLRPLPPNLDLDWLFLESVTRRVGKDGTLSVKGRRFEAGPHFIGRKCEIRYDPYDLRRVWLVTDQGERHTLRPLDPHANCHVRRNPLPDTKVAPDAPPLIALQHNADELERENRPLPPEGQDPDQSAPQNPEEETLP